MFKYAVLDKHGREKVIGSLQMCDEYMMSIYKSAGRVAYYELKLVSV
jgi:hypothetical protein